MNIEVYTPSDTPGHRYRWRFYLADQSDVLQLTEWQRMNIAPLGSHAWREGRAWEPDPFQYWYWNHANAGGKPTVTDEVLQLVRDELIERAARLTVKNAC